MVTGDTRGLGSVIVKAFLAEGASVLVEARDATPVDELVRMGGDRVGFHKADVTVADSVHDLVQSAHDRFGGPDILVANAGVSRPGPAATLTEDH